MEYCDRPFSHVYVMPDGSVKLCAWTTKVVGNLLKQNLDEIWNSQAAKEMRDSIRDGGFRFCCKTNGCPYCENNSLPILPDNLDKTSLMEYFTPLQYPSSYNCAIDWTCNLSCVFCRHEVFVPDEQYNRNMDIIIDKLFPFISKADHIVTDGLGDCFTSPKVMKLLENLRPENPNMRITFETNGVFLDEAHWTRISHLSDHFIRVVVSPNSFNRATYIALNGGHDVLDKVLYNLAFIRELREKNLIDRFEISIVSQDRNFRELPEFIQRCIDEFNVDQVIVKPIYHWFGMPMDEYLEKDILNPLHPYFEEYQDVLKDPRLSHPKIYWWGAKNLHPEKLMPADKTKKLFGTTENWLKAISDDPTAIRSYLMRNGHAKVGIYGYGRLGQLLKKQLGDLANIIVDQRALDGDPGLDENAIRVLADSAQYPEMDLLIVTPFYEYDTIYDSVRTRTNAAIVALDQFLDYVKCGNPLPA